MIGRNNLCFCGSGKKYKNCCLEAVELTHNFIANIKSEATIHKTFKYILSEVNQSELGTTFKIINDKIEEKLIQIMISLQYSYLIKLLNHIGEFLAYQHIVMHAEQIASNNYNHILPFLKHFARHCSEENIKDNYNILLVSGGNVIDYAFLLYYFESNSDLHFIENENLPNNYSLEDFYTKNIYPDNYEQFYDSDFNLMEGIDKFETYEIKNNALKTFSEKRSISKENIIEEINVYLNKNYGFKLNDFKTFSDYLLPLNHIKVNYMDESSSWSYILEFLTVSKIDFENYTELKNYYELHPVTKIGKTYIYGVSQIIYICDLLHNLIMSGDTQFFNYMDYQNTNPKELQGRICTYCERKALYVLVEMLYEKGYVFPMLRINDTKIPVADIQKIEEFNLQKSKFDSDLFFADPKRKIVYNLDLKYINSFPSIKTTCIKGKVKILSYLGKLKAKHEFICNDLSRYLEILDINDMQDYILVSCLCTVRPNYYCYSNHDLFENIKYTNAHRIIYNLMKDKEILSSL